MCSQEAELCQIWLSKDPVSAFWRNVVLLFVVVKRADQEGKAVDLPADLRPDPYRTSGG